MTRQLVVAVVVATAAVGFVKCLSCHSHIHEPFQSVFLALWLAYFTKPSSPKAKSAIRRTREEKGITSAPLINTHSDCLSAQLFVAPIVALCDSRFRTNFLELFFVLSSSLRLSATYVSFTLPVELSWSTLLRSRSSLGAPITSDLTRSHLISSHLRCLGKQFAIKSCSRRTHRKRGTRKKKLLSIQNRTIDRLIKDSVLNLPNVVSLSLSLASLSLSLSPSLTLTRWWSLDEQFLQQTCIWPLWWASSQVVKADLVAAETSMLVNWDAYLTLVCSPVVFVSRIRSDDLTMSRLIKPWSDPSFASACPSDY